MIDLHCHVLPGLDDGPASLDVALAMCRGAAGDGIDCIVASPHMLNGVYGVTAEQVRQAVRALTDALAVAGGTVPPGFRVVPGADVHLHEDLVAKLKAGEVVTINDAGRYFLLELPDTVLPSQLATLLFRLQTAGVRPVLTHPERHAGILRHPEALQDWADRGGLVQVTAGSYLGRFGPAARRAAERWTKEGLVHVVASDAHPLPGRETCMAAAFQRLREFAGPRVAGVLMEENPSRILGGGEI